MESLLKWTGNDTSYHEFIKDQWKKKIFPSSGQTDFFNFWNKCLSDGVLEAPANKINYQSSIADSLIKQSISDFPESDGLEIALYEKVGIGDGRHANNPWLQEMSDPVTRATWDNYLCISPKMANEKGWSNFDVVTINNQIVLPVLVQPGQAYGTVSVALGYGRTAAGKVAEGVGANVYNLLKSDNGNVEYHNTIDKIEKTGSGYYLALTQQHHSMEGRALVREASLKEFLKDPAAGNEFHKEVEKHNDTLYNKFDFPGHHWGMAIDLSKCVGCSACLIACTAENNVPVVGKNEVLRAHEMHWIRIDRYYSGEEDNPAVVRQPVMCQHCDNAPCENVCPVAATNHSDEGINQMAYNRCIGTRYCNNNCPYKVRRFNWFDYTQADAFKGNLVDPARMTLDLRRMVLNPDVTVRAKGVIEKCSFCIQRIQASKLTAKLEDRKLQDGEIRTACQQACPAEAIVFGDTNDPDSNVSKMFKDPRNYHLLEELHVLPSVGYLTKISHRKQKV
jgi:molybdopterin-containing oxidoreductase family iron-sulfur binding subunit